jgi:uncharacterized damage-inducible protein DinB
MTEPTYPSHTAAEREMLATWLDFERDAVLRKIDGARDDDLRRTMTPSGLTLLGIVKHLQNVEHWWFRVCFADEAPLQYENDEDPDADFHVQPGETTDAIVTGYRAVCARSREIAAAALLDDASKREGRDHTLRWIMVHMIEETARHAGHMDVIREQLDGATGI